MFDVKDGVAEWRKVYDLAKQAPVDGLITYEQLDALLGRDFRADRSPIYDAMRHLEADDRRTLANVKGVGYKIARADEHMGLAVGKHKRARRALRRGHSIAQAADRNLLTPEQAARMDALELDLARQRQMISRLDGRVKVVEVVQAKQDDRYAALVATLKDKGLLNDDEA